MGRLKRVNLTMRLKHWHHMCFFEELLTIENDSAAHAECARHFDPNLVLKIRGEHRHDWLIRNVEEFLALEAAAGLGETHHAANIV